ncbi:hypothetical protein [Hoeflea ulvae]|uniref:Uncharacterized protein n=1 Tax=Hoeflea ulvae TaxID=2983764 RepID=A0ABT3YG77_9HYPH|nr:hypothetical protein [Hoeflea ulvae]MCY0094899.1 hypothetical protein [Hoeflea ulvae]
MALPDISESLLVPMNIQAAVVNDPVLAGVAFTDGAYNYNNLTDYLSPAPTPFNDTGSPPAKGVHLHWELPAAFRHGTQADDKSQPEYPLVPNRWLVLRYWPGHSTARRQVKAWVLLSDHLGDDGSNSYVQPSGAQQGQPTRLGKVVSLGDFHEPDNALFLQAIAPGNTEFSAYRPNVENVFSLTDDATDNDGNPLLTGPNQTVMLSYLVVGWFSDPTHDPLHGLTSAADWAAQMSAMEWITTPFPFATAGASPPQKAFALKGYGDVSGQFPKGQSLTVTGSSDNDGSYVIADDPVYDPSYDHLTIPVDKAMASATADGYILPPGPAIVWPTTTLTHGLIYNLAWQNDTMPERPNSSPQEIARNVKLAVGNSSTDALAAMIVAEAISEEGATPAQAAAKARALEAFQTNMLATLNSPDGDAQLNIKLRDQWFAQEDGGVFWSLTANSAVNPQATANAAQQTWLADLNYFQQGHDRETRILITMQERLYMDWWRVQRINSGYVPPNLSQIWSRIEPTITQALPEEAAEVQAQQAIVDSWAARISALLAAPPSYVQDGVTIAIQTPQNPVPAKALELKASRMDRFFKPNDPVLLISGLGASHAQNGPDQSGQTVARCRLGADHISALTVTTATDPDTITLDSVAALTTPPGSTALPAGVENGATVLGAEALLLDPDNGDLIATVATASAGEITAAIRAGTDYTGQAPVDWSAVAWLQAWSPLYMEWKIKYYPTVTAPVIEAGNGPQWSFDRANWSFNGIDYVWTGGDVTNPFVGPAASGHAITASGSANKTITLGNAGDLSFRFVDGSQFTVSGSGALNGNYTVASIATSGNDFIITTNEPVADNGGTGTATPKVLSGAQITYGGRTFLTPQATYNFRNRLEQFIQTQHQAGHQTPALDNAVHLLDIIGGARYDIQAASAANRSFTILSSIDLGHLFAAGSTCNVAEAKANDGSYTVVSTSFDEDSENFVVVVVEPVTDAGIDGVLVPTPTEWDLLSQSVSGLTDQLIMRSIEPNAMAQGPVGAGDAAASSYDALVGDVSQEVPELTMGDSVLPAGGTPAPYFFPIRGGFFALTALELVDRFGQKINLMYANNNGQFANPDKLWETFSPLRSRWLATSPDTKVSNPQRLLRLPPRSAAGERLDFVLVSAPDKANGPSPDCVDIDLVGGANPVCGWVLPNHLDQGLLIYNANGDSLGELALSHRAGGVLEVVWFPTPEAANPIIDPTDPDTGIPNQYMRAFVAGILNQPDATRGQAFANFLTAIDSTLWAIDPLGGRSDQNLSVLVGRPLGLVRARLKLMVHGLAPVDESTQYVLPTMLPISAGDPVSNTIALTSTDASVQYYADLGIFARGITLNIRGSGGADGAYTIAAASYAGDTITLSLLEPLPASITTGNAVMRPASGTLTTTPFTLRLGRADLFDDGLIGYFAHEDYARFNNIHMPSGIPDAGYLDPVGKGNYLSLSPFSERGCPPPASDPAPVPEPGSEFVTMLVDPRASVHASTGILPTQTLTLPPVFYEGPLARLELSFRAGPVIVDTSAVRMPRPSEQSGTWSWVQKNSTGNGTDAWQEDPITPSSKQARLPRMPQELRDGWMKLTDHDFNTD